MEGSVSQTAGQRFIADENVGKLAKWLRMMGYDTTIFKGDDDSSMVRQALDENRVILTRDTHIVKRRLISSGRIKAALIKSDQPELQVREVVEALRLDYRPPAFTVCLECNHPLEERTKEQVKDRVPPYVFKTQNQYVECPACRRIYWRGTHWAAMMKKLARVLESRQPAVDPTPPDEEEG